MAHIDRRDDLSEGHKKGTCSTDKSKNMLHGVEKQPRTQGRDMLQIQNFSCVELTEIRL